jgi:hypothetical protein
MVLMLGLVSSARAQVTPGAIVTLNAADNPGNPNTWDNVANNGSPTLPGSYEFGTCVGGGGCDLGGTQPQLMSENVPGQGLVDFYRGGPNRGGMAENGSQSDGVDVTAGKILYPEAEPWSWKSAIHDDLRFGGQRPGELGGASAAPVDYNLVRIYPFALTSTEVTNNFNAGPGSIPESAGPCAFDGDSICSTDDLDALYAVFGGAMPPTDPLFDLNSDNVVNMDDLNQWLTLAASEHGYDSAYLPGDTDLDRDIDLTDFTGLAANFDPGGTYGVPTCGGRAISTEMVIST